MAVKKTHIEYKVRQRVVFEKRVLPTGEKYEVEEGTDTKGGKLVGWRSEVGFINYRMPVDEFIRDAEKIII